MEGLCFVSLILTYVVNWGRPYFLRGDRVWSVKRDCLCLWTCMFCFLVRQSTQKSPWSCQTCLVLFVFLGCSMDIYNKDCLIQKTGRFGLSQPANSIVMCPTLFLPFILALVSIFQSNVLLSTWYWILLGGGYELFLFRYQFHPRTFIIT